MCPPIYRTEYDEKTLRKLLEVGTSGVLASMNTAVYLKKKDEFEGMLQSLIKDAGGTENLRAQLLEIIKMGKAELLDALKKFGPFGEFGDSVRYAAGVFFVFGGYMFEKKDGSYQVPSAYFDENGKFNELMLKQDFYEKAGIDFDPKKIMWNAAGDGLAAILKIINDAGELEMIGGPRKEKTPSNPFYTTLLQTKPGGVTPYIQPLINPKPVILKTQGQYTFTNFDLISNIPSDVYNVYNGEPSIVGDNGYVVQFKKAFSQANSLLAVGKKDEANALLYNLLNSVLQQIQNNPYALNAWNSSFTGGLSNFISLMGQDKYAEAFATIKQDSPFYNSKFTSSLIDFGTVNASTQLISYFLERGVVNFNITPVQDSSKSIELHAYINSENGEMTISNVLPFEKESTLKIKGVGFGAEVLAFSVPTGIFIEAGVDITKRSFDLQTFGGSVDIADQTVLSISAGIGKQIKISDKLLLEPHVKAWWEKQDLKYPSGQSDSKENVIGRVNLSWRYNPDGKIGGVLDFGVIGDKEDIIKGGSVTLKGRYSLRNILGNTDVSVLPQVNLNLYNDRKPEYGFGLELQVSPQALYSIFGGSYTRIQYGK